MTDIVKKYVFPLSRCICGFSEGSAKQHLAAVLPSLAWPSDGLIKTNSMCRHVIFVVFFKFWIENATGDDFNQFLMDIPSFWRIICLCSWIRSYLAPKQYWWKYSATVATYLLALLPLCGSMASTKNLEWTLVDIPTQEVEEIFYNNPIQREYVHMVSSVVNFHLLTKVIHPKYYKHLKKGAH